MDSLVRQAWIKRIVQAYHRYVDRNPDDHERFSEYAWLYHGCPRDIAEEYWQNVPD